MKFRYRLAATGIALAAIAMAVSAATAAGAVSRSPAGNELTVVVTGSAFGLEPGESKTLRVPGKRHAGAADTGAAAGVQATCYLDGILPYLIEPAGQVRRAHFTASLNCPGITGRVQLNVGLQQLSPGGGYVNDNFTGPESNPAPLIILGVNSNPKQCLEFNTGPWRGLAHPVLTTDLVTYDFGWFPTYDVRLSC